MADGHPLTVNGILELISHGQLITFDGFVFKDIPLTDWYTGSNADVLLLDISMPAPNGINIIRELLHRFPKTRIVVLSDEDDPGVIRCMQSLGICAYQVKTEHIDDVIQTIVKVYMGEKVFPDNLQGGAAPLLVRRFIAPRASVELSVREIQVLKLISHGKTNPQIAAALDISPLTIKKHRENLLRKLNSHNTAQLISKARLKGLL